MTETNLYSIYSCIYSHLISFHWHLKRLNSKFLHYLHCLLCDIFWSKVNGKIPMITGYQQGNRIPIGYTYHYRNEKRVPYSGSCHWKTASWEGWRFFHTMLRKCINICIWLLSFLLIMQCNSSLRLLNSLYVYWCCFRNHVEISHYGSNYCQRTRVEW